MIRTSAFFAILLLTTSALAGTPQIKSLGIPTMENFTGAWFSIGPDFRTAPGAGPESVIYAFAQGNTVGKPPSFFVRSLEGSGSWKAVLPEFPKKNSKLPVSGAIRTVNSFQTKQGKLLLLSAYLEYADSDAEVVIMRLTPDSGGAWQTVHRSNHAEQGFGWAIPTSFVFLEAKNTIFGLTKMMASFGAEDEMGALMISDASGTRWKEMQPENLDSEGGLPFSIVLANPSKPSELWGSTENPCRDAGGVAVSENGGKTWLHLFDKIPTRQVSDMFIDPARGSLVILALSTGSTFESGHSAAVFEVSLADRSVKRTDLSYPLSHLSCRPGKKHCAGIYLDRNGQPGKYVELERSNFRIVREESLAVGQFIQAVPGSKNQVISYSNSSREFVKVTLPEVK